MIFDVQRFSTHDGPGIRTIVFLKGCSLRCQWCSNPESQQRGPEILFDAQRCIRCGSCLDPKFGGAMREVDGAIVPDRSKPVPEGLARVCPSLAIRLAGREVSVEALVVEVAKDKVFFDKSGGGVTFSGGEPLDQVEFLVGCVGKLGAEGIGVAIETCLAVAPETLEALLPYPIHWLVDVKHVDAGKYLDQTTGDLDQTLANVRALSLASTRVTYRIPLIPGFNDSDEDRGRILAFLGSLERASADALRVDILPYHELAAGKYLQLGRSSPYDRRPLTSERADQWRQALSDRGFSVDLGGR